MIQIGQLWFDSKTNELVFVIAVCYKNNRTNIVLLKIQDWALFELQILQDFISINHFHDWFFQWHKQL